jgi:hypothetical protein
MAENVGSPLVSLDHEALVVRRSGMTYKSAAAEEQVCEHDPDRVAQRVAGRAAVV